jgi:hypothetical protein
MSDRPLRPGLAQVHSPFRFQIDPLQRLALINIEKDPDPVYLGFEPQVFDCPHPGRGLLVIAYRRDGRVDVYHQPALNPDPAAYAVTGRGLHRLVPTPLEGAHFTVHPTGLEVYFAFTDLLGRPIRVELAEDLSRPRRCFSLLAPLGSSTENPPSLPLFFLREFGFFRRRGSQARVEIAGRSHRLDSLPVPVAGQRVYFTRYTTDPLILHFCPNYTGPLEPLPGAALSGAPSPDGEIYTLTERDGRPAVEHMRAEHANYPGRPHRVDLAFAPAFPEVTCLADGERREGAFEIQAGPESGKVSGVYAVWREGDVVRARLHPSGGWQHQEKLRSVRFIYAVAKVFRTWPATYEWNAEIRRGPDGRLWQQSAWRRLPAKS